MRRLLRASRTLMDRQHSPLGHEMPSATRLEADREPLHGSVPQE